jgi:hypothetical protein
MDKVKQVILGGWGADGRPLLAVRSPLVVRILAGGEKRATAAQQRQEARWQDHDGLQSNCERHILSDTADNEGSGTHRLVMCLCAILFGNPLGIS